jgi:hypothetical protein
MIVENMRRLRQIKISGINRRTLAAVCSLGLLAATINAQTSPIVLQLLPQSQTDLNYRIGAQAGFSVSYVPDQYRVYGTSSVPRGRWAVNDDAHRDYFWESIFLAATRGEFDSCDPQKDPRLWNRRCVDSIGLFTKRVYCNPSLPNYACENNDLWNAYPGRSNMSTFPVRPPLDDSGFGWPSNLSWGVKNFTPILDKNHVNQLQTSPPSSGQASRCHPHNPGEFATGTANAKVAQVKYADGTTRWFMAYNNQVHNEVLNSGYNGEDVWRAQWAYSSDGMKWNVENRPLFLDLTEKSTTTCSQGLFVVDMFVDNGYFYIVADRVYLGHLWFFRSKIDTNTSTGPGYDPNGWELRGTYDPATGKHRWVRITPEMLGTHIDFTGIGGEPILRTRFGEGSYGGALKQTTIGRVFTSSAANSPYRYIALTVDQAQPVAPATTSPVIVELWATDSLDKPFVYQSDVQGMPAGGYGYEMQFLRFPDNVPATPRLFDNNFELWVSQGAACEGIPNCCDDLPEKCPAGSSPPPASRAQSRFTVTRRRARLSGGIFGS